MNSEIVGRLQHSFYVERLKAEVQGLSEENAVLKQMLEAAMKQVDQLTATVPLERQEPSPREAAVIRELQRTQLRFDLSTVRAELATLRYRRKETESLMEILERSNVPEEGIAKVDAELQEIRREQMELQSREAEAARRLAEFEDESQAQPQTEVVPTATPLAADRSQASLAGTKPGRRGVRSVTAGIEHDEAKEALEMVVPKRSGSMALEPSGLSADEDFLLKSRAEALIPNRSAIRGPARKLRPPKKL